MDYQSYFKEVTLMSDFFMNLVFNRSKKAVEEVVRVILGNDNLCVEQSETQWEIKNPSPNGRSIRLDIFAADKFGNGYDTEIQQRVSSITDTETQQQVIGAAEAKRSRYYNSMLDTQLLYKSEPFENLRDSCVIFILGKDIYGKGLPLYHIERTVRELGNAPFHDGSQIIFVNGEYHGEDGIGHLMHDFHCKDPEEMFYPNLKKEATYFKVEERGKKIMCELLDKYLEEEMAEKLAQGRALDRAEILTHMASVGKTSAEISQLTGVPEAEVNKIILQKG